jgi:excinuclease ABC subunit C
VGFVQSQLARRRDLAAEALAFERAAQVQAAMTAIEWVVAEQKAALLEPQNMDIHGWADGILVSFPLPRRPTLRMAAAAEVGGGVAAPRPGDAPPVWTRHHRRRST